MWFTTADDASQIDLAFVSCAVLAVLRDKLTYFGIDAISDAPCPEDVRWAVDRLDERSHSVDSRLLGAIRRGPSITVELDLADAGDYEVAVATVPFTIHSNGLDDQSRPIYSVADTGTSAAFKLTPAEAEAARRAIQAAGGDPSALTPMR